MKTLFYLLILTIVSCHEAKISSKEPSQKFKDYWYAGNAEISSYELTQNRYGQPRKGKSVLVYVTEPFRPSKQVKADGQNKNNVSVLKLNSTKKFLTGLYPYSIMNSSFYPVSDSQHAIKLTTTVQEWCGQVFAQLNNRNRYEIKSFSYFESEGDQFVKLKKDDLESEIWNKIRINPKNLPLGKDKMLPSFEYLRLKHKDIKSYTAIKSLKEDGKISTYSIEYPELERTLSIRFQTKFPHVIESWSEKTASGYGAEAKRIKTINSAYWSENSLGDEKKRKELGLSTIYQ